jgi:hypothetical protein
MNRPGQARGLGCNFRKSVWSRHHEDEKKTGLIKKTCQVQDITLIVQDITLIVQDTMMHLTGHLTLLGQPRFLMILQTCYFNI